MEIQEYIEQKIKLNDIFLEYIESESNDEENLQNLIEFINNSKNITEDQEQLRDIITILFIISRNHHREPNFFLKIEQFYLTIKEEIKQTFSNEELFHIFRKDKRILLFLFKEKIIQMNKWIFDYFYSRRLDVKFKNFFYYFFPELKDFIKQKEEIEQIEEEMKKINANILTDFEEKRFEGENDSLVTSLIRKDSIEEFISYVSRTNFSLSNKIDHSIFETNLFLLKNEPTIIEYAAFFGSIQIFKYLLLNNVELTSSLWIYAIHSKNPEMIHLLEFNHVEIEYDLYKICLKESIKCHHNDIAIYFQNNFINEETELNNFENKFGDNVFDFGFHYHNYSFFPEDFSNNKFIIFYLCKYDYLAIVELLLKIKELDFKETIIQMRKKFL